MCQIIAYHAGNWREVGDLDAKIESIMTLLKDKGGDLFSVANNIGLAVAEDGKICTKFYTTDADKFEKYLREILFDHKNLRRLYGPLLFFSRQTPSLEIEETGNPQPYVFNDESETDSSMIAVHGTIPNTEELEKKYKTVLKVDTDIFMNEEFIKEQTYGEGLFVNKGIAKGSFIVVKTNDSKINIINNGGLGFWEIFKNKNEVLVAMSALNPHSKYCNNKEVCYNLEDENKLCFITSSSFDVFGYIPKTKNVFLCSGGLDSICTVLKVLSEKDNTNRYNTLTYIAWGTRAEKEEIKAVYDLQDNLFRLGYNVEVDIIDAKDLFESYLVAAGYNLDNVRLLSKDSKGQGKEEAEYGSSYVPLRNTFMVNLIAAKYEKLFPNSKVNIYLGLNLDDGMAANMLDNTNGWLYCINQTIKLSGYATLNFEVKAPFVNKTKKNMIKDVIGLNFNSPVKTIIENSFSCYFPKDGKACGACGSCLMRQNVFGRVSDGK